VDILGIIVLGNYLLTYNSIENQCRRKYQQIASNFSPDNKLQKRMFDTVVEQQIAECIKGQNKLKREGF
jgi:hypothetical protein